MGADMSEPWHRLSNVDAPTNTGSCSVCGDSVRLHYRADRNTWECWTKRRANERRNKNRPGRKEAIREWNNEYVKRKHAKKRQEWAEKLAEIGNACEICQKPLTIKTAKIDHDHSCCPPTKHCANCIRGILCNSCNAGMGMLGDTPEGLERARNYLLERSIKYRAKS